jgi:hypothetical protein
MGDQPRATVREVDGQLVLEDPDALAVLRAVAKHNCRGLFELNADRVTHFVKRIAERGAGRMELVIVLLNVDDQNGAVLADILMPGVDWQPYRDRGEMPVARGLAERTGIQDMLDLLDPEAAKRLRETDGTAIVVMDHGVAEVFTP